MAMWADALGVPRKWPFVDLAGTVDPSLETDPVWMERLEAERRPQVVDPVQEGGHRHVRWASLDDGPRSRFLEFDDPYERMIQLSEWGGEIWPGHGAIEFYLGSVRFGSIAERLAQEPRPIDAATLDAVDDHYRIGADESRARVAAQRAERAAEKAQPPAD